MIDWLFLAVFVCCFPFFLSSLTFGMVIRGYLNYLKLFEMFKGECTVLYNAYMYLLSAMSLSISPLHLVLLYSILFGSVMCCDMSVVPAAVSLEADMKGVPSEF